MTNREIMEAAARIHDPAQRHAYVYDNGGSDKGFFDVDARIKSPEFSLLRDHCEKGHDILEVGCFTGLNLLGLGLLGYTSLVGIEFVRGALEWMEYKAHELRLKIPTCCAEWPCDYAVQWCCGTTVYEEGTKRFDRVILFDVLEHQQNVGDFLHYARAVLKSDGRALILVPAGREYYDCGHCAFWPDVECLENTLAYHFNVIECRRVDRKLFAICEKRN